jgi:hypothetical protein
LSGRTAKDVAPNTDTPSEFDLADLENESADRIGLRRLERNAVLLHDA